MTGSCLVNCHCQHQSSKVKLWHPMSCNCRHQSSKLKPRPLALLVHRKTLTQAIVPSNRMRLLWRPLSFQIVKIVQTNTKDLQGQGCH
uniref:Uncharacterized protein n=1 Tax=Arundo donax TaxID=35708 RepID=A0A0A9BF03_ARUDO